MTNLTIKVYKFRNTPPTLRFFITMKYKNWNDFKLDVSAISKIMTIPTGFFDLNKSQRAKYELLINKKLEKQKDIDTLEFLKEKVEKHLNHPLSDTAKSYLRSRYGQLKYDNRSPAKQKQRFTVVKGVSKEKEALEMLSELHGIEYYRPENVIENDFLKGRSDCICINGENLVEIKIGWNTRSFFSNLGRKLEYKAWYQTQGYLDLYGLKSAKVCYCLVNSPEHLVQQALADIYQKYCFGIYTYDEYQEKTEDANSIYNYDNIPLRRKIITYEVRKHQPTIEKLKRLVKLCRNYLNELEVLHIDNKISLSLHEDYVSTSEENSTEHNADVTFEGN